MKLRVLLASLLLLAACDSSADPGPTTSSSTTTTTIENDTCDRVAADTAAYLELLIDTLDDTRLEELVHPDEWGQDLLDVQRAGRDLDLRVNALRCDTAEIQQRAFAEADLIPGGALSERLLELLLMPEDPATTATTTVDTTSSTVAGTTTTTVATSTSDA